MNVAIFGYGTIGSGVADLLKQLDSRYNLSLYKVFDRPSKRNILGELLEDKVEAILQDSKVDIVVETLGGIELAYKVIKGALEAHKHVVTSNKEVVNLYLSEFVSLAQKNEVMFLFEASVGGGIPIIKSLCNVIKYDNVSEIYGIINGTSNYVLTEIDQHNMSLQEAILEAQRLGYAEADPTADLEGLDMVRKISILTMLANNTYIDSKRILNKGITYLPSYFVTFAKERDYVIKFIARSKKEHDCFEIYVEPVVVHKDSIIANVNGAYNAIFLECQYNGRLMFNGLGAGKYATATAVISDLIDVVEKDNYVEYKNEFNAFVNTSCERSDYYVVSNNQIILKKNILKDEAMKYAFYARIM